MAGELAVAGVAAAFYVGAVGGDAGVHVAELGVYIRAVDPVQNVAVGIEGRRNRNVGVNLAYKHFFGLALNNKISESEPGERGADGAFFAGIIAAGILA